MALQVEVLLHMNDLSFSAHPKRFLFQNIHLTIFKNDKIGLIGDNGCGKSTLLKLLAKKNTATYDPSKIYYIPQIELAHYQSDELLFTFLEKQYSEWWEILEKLEQCFDMSLAPDLPLKALSGGQWVQLYIAMGLVFKPTIWLLDEPTNHLDLDAKHQLIKLLQTAITNFVLVSHDAHFLNLVTHKIWAFESSKISCYSGNYKEYQTQKAAQLQAQKRQYEAASKEHKKAMSFKV